MERLKKNPENGLYQFPKADFERWSYKHRSITHPGLWAAFLPGCGTTLFLEGKHFEIVN